MCAYYFIIFVTYIERIIHTYICLLNLIFINRLNIYEINLFITFHQFLETILKNRIQEFIGHYKLTGRSINRKYIMIIGAVN